MIGISITTRNRPEVLKYTLDKFFEYFDDKQLIIVIDDASDCWEKNRDIVTDYGFIYVLNEKRKGIPDSKDRAFRMMLHCDYQVWFDDDCFPICNRWYIPITLGMIKQGHMLYLKPWTHIKLLKDGDIQQYSGATACLMTFRKDMYNDVMGFNIGFEMYGNWHHMLSIKMQKYNLYRYGTVKEMTMLVHSFDIDGVPKDFKGNFGPVMSIEERRELLIKWNKKNNHWVSKIP